MTAQNGRFTELLQFKRGEECAEGAAWSFRLVVDKQQGVGFLPGEKKPTIVGTTTRLYQVPEDANGWIGDGRCR